jgi:hypothetical protein
MGRQLLRTILQVMVASGAMTLLLVLWPMALPAEAAPAASPLERRQAQWPSWSLPAPLARPGTGDLVYPDWLLGEWRVSSSDGASYSVRFQRRADGAVVGDRAFNARAVGQALLGEHLLRVANDPANPNRQIAMLAGEQQLESTVIGRRSERPGAGSFLADELALQVLHRPGAPRLSQVEVLSRYERQDDGSIQAEQWQASFAAPGAGSGLSRAARSSDHFSLNLVPQPTRPTGAAQPTGRAS